MVLKFRIKSQIESSIERIDELLATQIFWKPTIENEKFHDSAFIEILILLRDLMYQSEKYVQRISFIDDILLEEKIVDITDLIKYLRDALCHLDSDNHLFDKEQMHQISFCGIKGKGNFAKIGDVTLSSDYDDDICFFFGRQKIYLDRHIVRAFNCAKENFLPLL